MEYNCIAVDDEPLALNILKDYISKIDYLNLIGTFTSPIEAHKALLNGCTDIVFLDIQMPELSGFELLESVYKKTYIIFTTAYDNYAVESYDFDAIDYLLKPFSFSRFLKAIDKVSDRVSLISNFRRLEPSAYHDNFVFINDNGIIIKILFADVDYIKGYSDYIIIKTKGKNYIIRENLKQVEEILEQANFIRIHKSFIIQLDKIEKIEGHSVYIAGESIPIGQVFRKNFEKRINGKLIG